MGALAGFIERKEPRLENEPGAAAKVANPAKADPDLSNFSDFSRGAPLNFDSAALQREADRRNRAAAAARLTDRFCACGRLARMAWADADGREVWRCDDCS